MLHNVLVLTNITLENLAFLEYNFTSAQSIYDKLMIEPFENAVNFRFLLIFSLKLHLNSSIAL